MTRHTVSFADQIFLGKAYNEFYNGGKRGVELSHLYFYDMGEPLATDAEGIDANLASNSENTLTYEEADLEVSTLDIPRNLTVRGEATDDNVVTITGTDFYGQTQVETITAAETAVVAGTKAFASVEEVSIAPIEGVTAAIDIGWGDVFGLPFKADKVTKIWLNVDGEAETPAAFVAGDAETDAEQGDVRGTVDPTTAADGSAEMAILMVVDRDENTAAFGVTPSSGYRSEQGLKLK